MNDNKLETISNLFEGKENRKIAKMGGHAAKVARDDIEKNLGKSVISKTNALNYKYLDTNTLDKNRLEEKNDKFTEEG